MDATQHDTPETPRWQRALGLLLSAVIAALLARAVADLGWGAVVDALPANPLFYLLLVAAYLTLPGSELLIFRRLWGLRWPALGVFVKKRVLNDAVAGYAGEAWLYLWARGRAPLKARALAGVKDVAITSALAGNLATLLLVLIALPLMQDGTLARALSGEAARMGAYGVALVMGASVVVLLLRGRVLSLPPRDNLMAFGIACGRLLAAGLLVLLAWWIALPHIPLAMWLLLGALRLVISRLPLIPNKDLLFTAVAVSLTGPAQPQVAALLAACAALTLIFHVAAFVVVQAADLTKQRSFA